MTHISRQITITNRSPATTSADSSAHQRRQLTSADSSTSIDLIHHTSQCFRTHARKTPNATASTRRTVVSITTIIPYSLRPACRAGSAKGKRRGASGRLQHGGGHPPVGVHTREPGDGTRWLRRLLCERGGEARLLVAARAHRHVPPAVSGPRRIVSEMSWPLWRVAAAKEVAKALAVSVGAAADSGQRHFTLISMVVVALVLPPSICDPSDTRSGRHRKFRNLT